MNISNPKTVSIIVAVHNQRDHLQRFHTVLCETLWRLSHDFEIIFVDDGSMDKSGDLIAGMAKRDPRIRLFTLPHCFGQEAAIGVGLHVVRGVTAIIMDAGDPSALVMIPRMLQLWGGGAQMVTVATRRMYGWRATIGSWSKAAVPAMGSRLVDRVVIDAYKTGVGQVRQTLSPLDRIKALRRATVFSLPGGLVFSSRSDGHFLIRCIAHLGPVAIRVLAAAFLFVTLVAYFTADPSSLLRVSVLMVTSLAFYAAVLVIVPLAEEWQVRPFVELGSLLRFVLASVVEHPHPTEDVPSDHDKAASDNLRRDRRVPTPSPRVDRFLKFVRHFPPAAYA